MLLTSAVLGLCLLPLGIFIHLVCTSCSNVPTNDFAELVGKICKILDPGYNWTNLISDCSMSSHCIVLPLSMHLINARLFQWNVQLDLFLGLSLAFIRGLAIFFACTRKGTRTDISALLLLLAIAWFTFGAANTSVLLYNEASVAYGVTLLGFVLGAFCLSLAENGAVMLPFFCGWALVASFSNGGSALFSWPCYGAQIILSQFKKQTMVRAAAVLVFGGAISAGLILYLLKSNSLNHSTISPHPPNPLLLLQGLALPFLNGTTLPQLWTTPGLLLGSIGLVLLLSLAVYYTVNRLWLKESAFALSLALFAILNLLAAAIFRPIMAPWYSVYAGFFWIAVLALLSGLQRQFFAAKKIKLAVLSTLVSVSCLLLLALSNLSYRDKDAFRFSHGPASEGVMRHFLDVPTYGEINLFSFTVGGYERIADLARPLAARGLAVFAGPQCISLQSEFVLPTVRFSLPSHSGQCRFVKGANLRGQASWKDPDRLNLALIGSAACDWLLPIDELTESGRIETAIIGGRGKNVGGRASIKVLDAVSNVVLHSEDYKPSSSWQNVVIDLAPYLKESPRRLFKLVLQSGSDEVRESKQYAIFANPRLYLAKKKDWSKVLSNLPQCPANTEFSASFYGPGPGDLVYVADQSNFSLLGLEPLSAPGAQTNAHQFEVVDYLSSLTFVKGLRLDGRAADRFYVEIAVPENVRPRALCCQLVINGTELKQVFIPLLKDSKLHSYVYDLKLLELNADDNIVGFKLLPVYMYQSPGDAPPLQIEIGKIGFLARR